MKDDFYKAYPNTQKHEFSISKALMSMIETNIELNKFVKGDFEVATKLAVEAWNLALINDKMIIALGIKALSKELKSSTHKSQKQNESILNSLIKLKQELYPNVYRQIIDYSSDPDENGKPYLRVVSGGDLSPNYMADKYREALFGSEKYGWVRDKS
jgi:hypothetical protein